MSRLSVKLQYDKKMAELREMIESEAKRLQDVVDLKEAAIFEIKELARRKSIILNGLADLDQEVASRKNTLNHLINTESSFVSSVKVELNKEKESLEDAKKEFGQVSEKLKESNKVAGEITTFIEKEKNVRDRYLEEKEKLRVSEASSKIISKKVSDELEELSVKNREMDAYKQYLTDLYGKLASYARVAKETVEFANDYFEKHGIKLKFALPPDKIAEVNFDNFNKKQL